MPIPGALERIACVQAQYAPSMYIGLWSRLEGLERGALTEVLERRRIVQATLMRATIHLASAADYWPLEIAVAQPRRKAWLAYGPRATQTSAREMAALARRVRSRMAGGQLTRAEIQEITGDAMRTNGVGMWLDLVRVPPSGTWERRRADLFALAEDWLGPAPELGAAQAARHLVQRYLRGFGPARPAEIADWAGLPVAAVSAALRTVPTRSFRDEAGRELVDLPRLPLPDPAMPVAPRFLPTWDATLLAHARGAGVIREEDRPRIFNTRTPQSAATFLVDGVVAGTWRFERGRVRIEPFRRLDARDRRAVMGEAERLAAFHT